MESLNSFKPLIERCAEFDINKHDTVAASKDLRFVTEVGQQERKIARLIVPGEWGSVSLGVEDTALQQLGGRMGPTFWGGPNRVIPSDMFRQMYRAWPEHFAGFANGLLDAVDSKILVRAYDDQVRAVLSDQYARLDNAEVLEMADQVLSKLPSSMNLHIIQSGKYYRDNDGVQRDELAIRVVVKEVMPRDEPGGYGLGVLIRNGETGGSASEVRPLVMRTSCLNSLVFKTGESGERLGLRLTHRGNKQAKITMMAAAIAEALPMAEDGLNRFLATKQQEIDLESVIKRLGENYGWGEAVRTSIAVGTEGNDSLFGLVNGMTYAAHEAELDTAGRLEMESLAAMFVQQPALVTR